jgi:hypothetical protein
MQALLSEFRQGVAPSDLAQPERAAKDMVNSGQNLRLGVDTLKDRISIHDIVDVPCAALFVYLLSVTGGFLECFSQGV